MDKDKKKKQDEVEDLEAFFDEATQADDTEPEAGSDTDQKPEQEEEQTTDQNEPESENENGEDEEVAQDEQEQKEETTEEEPEDIDIESSDPALLVQKYKTLQGMYRAQKKKLEELAKQKSEPQEETQKQEQEQKPAKEDQQTEEPEVDTSWVGETLKSTDKFKEFSDEFPEIAGVLESALSSIMEKYTKTMAMAFQTLMEQIDQKYQPIASSVQEISKKEKLSEIKQYHPDYDEIINSQELQDWIDSQPPLLKDAYNKVLQEGTVQDLAELLNDFKLKTGKLKNTNQPSRKSKKKPKTAPETKTKAPSSTEPVDMDDFEQAFYEAVREGV